MTVTKRTGIIGGSGLYAMQGIEILDELDIDTPWGKPSAPLLLASYHGQEIVFLPRHGAGHGIPPHKINYRANIYAMKQAGVSRIISVSAVGSLRENIAPGDFVLVDQFVDRTINREKTFFDGPIVAHVSMADPICSCLQKSLIRASKQAAITTHEGGTYLVMQGPQFSTRAESMLYRSWNMDVIGMTNMPEAKLAREAEICYASVAMITDYDSWHPDHGAVDISEIIKVLTGNADKARTLVKGLPARLGSIRTPCPDGCDHALEYAIMTAPEARDPALVAKLDAVAGRVLG
jgi:5'-methylthioadenosine phosphorylase